MSLFNEKDLVIIQALDKFGPKTSTRQLSKILDIPSRTIRYRISKLKEISEESEILSKSVQSELDTYLSYCVKYDC